MEFAALRRDKNGFTEATQGFTQRSLDGPQANNPQKVELKPLCEYIIIKAPKFSQASPNLKSLYWLKINRLKRSGVTWLHFKVLSAI